MKSAVGLIFILTLGVYVAGNPEWLWLWPLDDYLHSSPYQLVTHIFCHSGLIHLLINLLALVSFGPALERRWGSYDFLAAYLYCGAAGGVLQASISTLPVIGASGALFGMFFAYAWMKPRAKIVTIIPWPMPAWLCVTLYAAISLAAWMLNWMPGVAHAAHLAGGTAGLLLAISLPTNNKPQA